MYDDHFDCSAQAMLMMVMMMTKIRMMMTMMMMTEMMTIMMTMMILALANPKSKCSSYAAELMRLTARPHAEAQNVME